MEVLSIKADIHVSVRSCVLPRLLSYTPTATAIIMAIVMQPDCPSLYAIVMQPDCPSLYAIVHKETYVSVWHRGVFKV